jgi:hypothetical protein
LYGGGRQRREAEQRRKSERAASASARGWQYDGTIVGDIHYRISSKTPTGAAWQIHYDSDQSSSSPSPKLVFLSEALAGPIFVWTIHDKKTYDFVQRGSVRMIVGSISRLVGAFSESMKIKRDFYVGATTLPAGSRAFQARYVLAALDTRWSLLIDSEIERLVLNWPYFKQSMSSRDNCISAELAPAGLRVQIHCDAPDVKVIEQLAELGQRLTDATRAIRVD